MGSPCLKPSNLIPPSWQELQNQSFINQYWIQKTLFILPQAHFKLAFYMENHSVLKPYALEIINLQDRSFEEQQTIKRVSGVQAGITSKFVIRIHQFFRYKSCQYFVIVNDVFLGCVQNLIVTRNFTQKQKQNLIFGILLGLKKIHEHKEKHLRINPYSLLIGYDGFVKIKLPNLSYISKDEQRQKQMLFYKSPQYELEKETFKSDIWSAALIMIQLMSNQLIPRTGNKIWKSQSFPNNLLSSIKSLKIRDIIRKMLFLNPKDRPHADQLVFQLKISQQHILPLNLNEKLPSIDPKVILNRRQGQESEIKYQASRQQISRNILLAREEEQSFEMPIQLAQKQNIISTDISNLHKQFQIKSRLNQQQRKIALKIFEKIDPGKQPLLEVLIQECDCHSSWKIKPGHRKRKITKGTRSICLQFNFDEIQRVSLSYIITREIGNKFAFFEKACLALMAQTQVN